MSADNYGRFYFAVVTNQDKIWLYADSVQVVDGALVFCRQKDGFLENFAFATGQWKYFYAASCVDGGAVAVEHWDSVSVKNGRPTDAARTGISPSLRHEIFKRDNYTCKLCGKKSDDGVSLVIDHIIPVAKGGTSSKRNLQTLCDPCNAGKAAK